MVHRMYLMQSMTITQALLQHTQPHYFSETIQEHYPPLLMVFIYLILLETDLMAQLQQVEIQQPLRLMVLMVI